MDKSTIKLTILFDHIFWVGVFEQNVGNYYSVAKKIFGEEPTEPEVFNFITQEYQSLQFTTPMKEGKSIIKKANPKRLQREAKKCMENATSISKAQDALRVELEKNKKEKKQVNKLQKEAINQMKFAMKQAKKKKKHNGH